MLAQPRAMEKLPSAMRCDLGFGGPPDRTSACCFASAVGGGWWTAPAASAHGAGSSRPHAPCGSTPGLHSAQASMWIFVYHTALSWRASSLPDLPIVGTYEFTYGSSVLHKLMKGTRELGSMVLNHASSWPTSGMIHSSVNLIVDPTCPARAPGGEDRKDVCCPMLLDVCLGRIY